ncbi:uncharacterized protein si:dkey-9i23.6 [Danio aesculapii]|uniref:uncharacterized protein si:dkey-9i23.6 n=1 Tax=Danio aesculapii TaxID=1142201 RepID=UPI0024BF644D|nr:uncharacterized protein si:dkey-9i23.6 [Danio aesculapii]XP_056312700.1 uncharacterized protein si:dkey-9i23.6 [Danio aesculapii]
MEEQTAKSDAKDGQLNHIPFFQSVLKKRPKGTVNNPKTDKFPDTACKTVFYGGCSIKEGSKDSDSTVRSDGDEEQSSKISGTFNVSELVPSDAREGQRSDIPLLESMLNKLMIQKERANHHTTDRLRGRPDKTSKSVFHHSVESVTNEDRSDFDSTVRSDADQEKPARSSDREDGKEESKGVPEEFPKWERRIFSSVPLALLTKVAEMKESKLVEVKNNKDPSMVEDKSEAALLQDESSQQLSAPNPDLSVSSDRADFAQTKTEVLDEACSGPSNTVSMDTGNAQTAEKVVGRTTRSASEPVSTKPKEERPLSAPSALNSQEFDKYADIMTPKHFSKAAVSLELENSGMTEQNNSLAKTQKKGVKHKMKNFTQKLKERFKEKQDCEQNTSTSAEDNVEEEEQPMETEDPDLPPPLPTKKGKYVILDRKFTLRDFKLNIEPINLMEEIFTGDEWLNYLPTKGSSDEKDTSDQSISYDPPKLETDNQVNVPEPIPEPNPQEDIKTTQDSVDDTQQDKAAEVNSQARVERVESNTSVFAIPKALLTNNAIKQMTDCEPKKSDDIYDCVDIYILPKNDIPTAKRKASEVNLIDFSAIKSFALLDNSALKSRIRLSKKRPHRPPKKHKKVKAEKSNAIFYKIPPVILNESPLTAFLPRHSTPFSPPPHLPTKCTPSQ